jgi:IS1 family transposase
MEGKCYCQGMNKLPLDKRTQILAMLCEGSSMRSISRVCDVSINTVSKLLVDAGAACATFHDSVVRGVKAKRVQVDEIWSFTAAKEKNVAGMKRPVKGAGDTWTWTALDADSKLIVSYLVADRSWVSARLFMLNVAARLANRVQLTSDSYRAYLTAVEGAFGKEVDYAQLDKIYATPRDGQVRYSPPVCVGAKRRPRIGNPDPDKISTSYVERSNLTMRMHMRRFTRLTNAFSKKFDNHKHMVALYTVWYNFVKQHKTLKGLSPAMAADLDDKLWSMTDLAEMVEARLPQPGKRGPYKKQAA